VSHPCFYFAIASGTELFDSGVIDTPMHRANLARVKNFTPTPATPIPRDGTAQEVANVVIFLLSEESSFVTGDAWNVDGGANA
jgi:NAD(P)-dependent dehydrogenase (short-subunit alcohol dehydrogenase family)